MTNEKPENTKECLRCGVCCTELEGNCMIVSPTDVKLWIENERFDILSHLVLCLGRGVISGEYGSCASFIKTRDNKQCENCSGGDIVNYKRDRCVFLRKKRNSVYECLIQDVKPEHCKGYVPGTDECCPQYSNK